MDRPEDPGDAWWQSLRGLLSDRAETHLEELACSCPGRLDMPRDTSDQRDRRRQIRRSRWAVEAAAPGPGLGDSAELGSLPEDLPWRDRQVRRERGLVEPRPKVPPSRRRKRAACHLLSSYVTSYR